MSFLLETSSKGKMWHTCCSSNKEEKDVLTRSFQTEARLVHDLRRFNYTLKCLEQDGQPQGFWTALQGNCLACLETSSLKQEGFISFWPPVGGQEEESTASLCGPP